MLVTVLSAAAVTFCDSVLAPFLQVIFRLLLQNLVCLFGQILSGDFLCHWNTLNAEVIYENAHMLICRTSKASVLGLLVSVLQWLHCLMQFLRHWQGKLPRYNLCWESCSRFRTFWWSTFLTSEEALRLLIQKTLAYIWTLTAHSKLTFSMNGCQYQKINFVQVPIRQD